MIVVVVSVFKLCCFTNNAVTTTHLEMNRYFAKWFSIFAETVKALNFCRALSLEESALSHFTPDLKC